MADIKQEFGTSTAMTITLAALAAAAAREGTAVDNTTNKFLDAEVTVKLMTGTATGPDNAVYIYAYGSEDGTNYGGGVTGTDAAVTTTPTNLTLVKVASVGILTTTSFIIVVGSIATAFGGTMPRKWGIVVDNRAGALNGTAGNFAATYSGIYATSV